MRQFLIQLLIFFTILFVADRIMGMILSANRPGDYASFLDAKIDFFKGNFDVDMLIIGDSHVADALDTRTIDERLNLSSFNLGIYHTSPFENYYVTKAALQDLPTQPRFIVLGTNPSMFERPLYVSKYTPLILPLASKSALIFKSEEGFNANFFSQTLQERYLFSALRNRISGKPYQPTREVETVYSGHLKFFNQLMDADWSAVPDRYTGVFNHEQVAYFAKTIEMAQKAGVKVIIAHPPIWRNKMEAIRDTKSYIKFEQTIAAVVSKYKLSEYHTSAIDTSGFVQQDFLDPQHLNYQGSEKYTEQFYNFLVAEGAID